MKRILIIGAASAIAQETARCFAGGGAAFFLVGRSAEKLSAVADDLRVRGAGAAATWEMDANDFARHAEMLDAAEAALGGLDAALIAHGTLPHEAHCRQEAAAALEAFSTNTLSTVALLTHLANRFEAQGHGCLAVISSVAGDRGRGSNYVYGATKAAVTTFMQGLRARFAGTGIRVVTIKPGLVDTPMTAALPKNALYARPDAVGRRIHRAMVRGESVVYTPGFWRFVLFGIRAVPEGLFTRYLSRL